MDVLGLTNTQSCDIEQIGALLIALWQLGTWGANATRCTNVRCISRTALLPHQAREFRASIVPQHVNNIVKSMNVKLSIWYPSI